MNTLRSSNFSNKFFGQIILLFFILILAFYLRVYQLDVLPPSFNWDETAAAYNAYTISNFGVDEFGRDHPIVFYSFGDDKHPIHIYTTALFFKLFGVSDFNARLGNAVFGTLSVLAITLLVWVMFGRFYLAILAGLLLATSPYHIHFSRGLWEVIYALFYFMLGLYLFYLGLKRRNFALSLAFLAFGISLLSYHSSKIVVLPIVGLLCLLYFKELIALKWQSLIGGFIFFMFLIIILTHPGLLGLARVQQTKYPNELIEETQWYKKTHNHLIGYSQIVMDQYLMHFTPQYLFTNGDPHPRNALKKVGMFYPFEAILMIVGLLALFTKFRGKKTVVLLVWLILAPLPSAMVRDAPNATRALFMMGSLQILSALGGYTIIGFFKRKNAQIILSLVLVFMIGLGLKNYLNQYYSRYSNDAIEWQYGMKQIVEYVKTHPEYTRVYMTDVRSQPYIFFLYYLHVDPKELLKTVIYNKDERNKSYNLIYSFDRYQFGGWDVVQSMPDPGNLYIIEDSKYGGLAHQQDFKIDQQIKFPNGGSAFYIISKK